MKASSLSESMPRSGKGSLCFFSPGPRRSRPGLYSVSLRFLPSCRPHRWRSGWRETHQNYFHPRRSPSLSLKTPGFPSSHSEKVLSRTWCLRKVPGLVLARDFSSYFFLSGLNSLSIVAAGTFVQFSWPFFFTLSPPLFHKLRYQPSQAGRQPFAEDVVQKFQDPDQNPFKLLIINPRSHPPYLSYLPDEHNLRPIFTR